MILPAAGRMKIHPSSTWICRRMLSRGSKSLGRNSWRLYVGHQSDQRNALSARRFPIRAGACPALARKWPDDNTRALLDEWAVQDGHAWVRVAGFRRWPRSGPTQATHCALLEERAVQDEHAWPRIAALQALAEKWPDEDDACPSWKIGPSGMRRMARPPRFRRWPRSGPTRRRRALLEDRAVQDDSVNSRTRRASGIGREVA